MKKNITIGLFLLTLTAFANQSSEPTIKDTKTVSNTKIVDTCSITEIRNYGDSSITITITASTCEEAGARLKKAFAEAEKIMFSIN